MKILKIILVVFFLLSVVPLAGYCDDAHAQEASHQCTVICHAPCCNAALPHNSIGFIPPAQSVFLSVLQENFLEIQFLSISFRPPIVSAS